MPDVAAPIGVFDSGVGGLTVFRAIRARLPAESLTYLGDTARVPYGTKSAETVARFAGEAGRWLEAQGIKALVVACNSASAVALETLREELSVPVFGVIGPGARAAVERSRRARIGVLATRGTVNSGAYPQAILELRPGATVVQQAAPLLVPLAEEGWHDHPVAETVAREYCRPLLDAGVDTIVLGCTHYPLLASTLAKAAGPRTALVDSAEATADELAERLAAENLLHSPDAPRDPRHRWFVTDGPEPFQAVAERFLGTPESLERVSIDTGEYDR